MINVQPFLDRLEQLKDHMDLYIEVLHTSHYFKCQLVEERNADWKIKYLNPSSPIQSLILSDDGSIKAHLDLFKHLTGEFDKWVNDHIGIPEERMGKPAPFRSDREVAMAYSEMAAETIKQKKP